MLKVSAYGLYRYYKIANEFQNCFRIFVETNIFLNQIETDYKTNNNFSQACKFDNKKAIFPDGKNEKSLFGKVVMNNQF